MIKKLVVFIVLVAGLLAHYQTAHAALYDPNLQVYTIKTEHFFIHFPKPVAPVAEDLSTIAEQVHIKLTDKLNWKPWGRTHIVLVDETDRANGLATVLPANYLLLLVTLPDADSSLDNYRDYLELLFTHEYTHILHMDQHFKMASPPRWLLGKIIAPNGLTPAWMREGIAAYEESVETGRGRANFSYSDLILRNAILENQFPSIDEIGGQSRRWPGTEASYIYGVKFFQWLSQKYGQDRIQRYMEEYASGLWLFSLNNKARRVYGKSFYKLWREWEGELKVKYSGVKRQMESEGLTPLKSLVIPKNMQAYPTASPEGGYAYVETGFDEYPEIIISKKAGSKPISLKRATWGQLAFSRDGGSLMAYSSVGGAEKYKTYSDVYVYNFKTRRIYRLGEVEKATKPEKPPKAGTPIDKDFDQTGLVNKRTSLRATDPDFSPEDGGRRWVLMVRSSLGTDNLYVYDIKGRKGYYLTDAPQYTQFSNPRYSPDGSKIIVSRRDHQGNRDIVLYSREGKEIRKVTNDEAIDNHPVWSPDGQVYFSSDRNGVPNIYRYSLNDGQIARVTNVVGGVYQPSLSADGNTLYVQNYTARGPGLSSVPVSSLKTYETAAAYAVNVDDAPDTVVVKKASSVLSSKKVKAKKLDRTTSAVASAPTTPVPDYASRLDTTKPTVPTSTILKKAKKYSAFPQVLVPRFVVPTFSTLDDAILLGLSIGRFDPLFRHSWNAYLNYRTDSNFIEGGATYSYMRYNPALYFGFIRYAYNWGNIFGTGTDFFEQRMQGYVGATYGLGHHSMSLSYFYENRDNLTAIPAAFTLPTLDRYAGLRSIYVYSRAKYFANSISQENGPYLKLAFDFTNSLLGSAETNEQAVLIGDMRYYFEMPWSNHHVLGIRSSVGWVWGDRESVGGTLRFGGPFGEGNLAGYTSRLFPFRGLPGVTFSGDRAMLSSLEYRLPIAQVDRGIGTWPIFLRNIHMSFFGDYGDIWARGGKDGRNFFEDFFLGVGTELKGDFVLGYGMPVTARLGYAIILLNRDRVAGLQDTLFKNDIRNGTVYLQFGSSF